MFKIMVPRRVVPSLGEFELLVLLATMSLGETAYPVSIAADIQNRTGRQTSRTSVLTTLERLEEKGLLTSRYGDPTPVRGGRAKRYFRPNLKAIDAVRQSVSHIETMTAGLKSLLKPR